jgi:hypothetical protein
MSQQFKRILLALAALCAISSASAFSLLGPFTAWQTSRLGYGLGSEVGGPMNLGEEYRWNTSTLYYGFDESFLNYFGTAGTNAVDQAFAMLNALPKVSQMSSNLTEFPTDATRVNYKASALGLFDVKSYILGLMMEELGLASPERNVWTLRSIVQTPPIYTIIKRNFDPVTLAPSSFVNGTLYTFIVVDPIAVGPIADAYEVQVDPLQFGNTSIANSIGGLSGGLSLGDYYTGLTRDDVGGLRYLYRTNNFQFEALLPGTTDYTSGSPWQPVGGGGTNVVSTNATVDVAIRPGVDKITFIKGKYDSLVGTFISITNVVTLNYVTNGVLHSQTVQRVLTQPDILISAEDLGVSGGGVPVRGTRTETTGWINNDALNGQATLDGPGVIQSPITLTLNKVGPWFLDSAPPFQDLFLPVGGFVWGSFDGTTNDPIIYPNGTSIYEMEQQVLYGSGSGSPYSIPNSLIVTTNTP